MTSRAKSAIWRSTSPAAPISRRRRSCSRSRIAETGKTLYTAFARCYVNDAAVMEARNPSYPGWAAEGYLTITPGNETDFGAIEDDILDLCKRFKVLNVAYDPWAATQLAQRLSAERVPVIEFRANTQNFSRAHQGAGRGHARAPHRA